MGGDPELTELLTPRAARPPVWLRAACVVGAAVCFALGTVGWLVPMVTGIPFYVGGLILLGIASDRVRRLINLLDRRLPRRWRRALRRALRRRHG
jgi:hypothetical protein